MRRLTAIVLCVAACGGATTSSPTATSPAPTATRPAPSQAADAQSPAAVPTASVGSTDSPIDAALVQKFKAAVVRLNQTQPTAVPNQNDWSVVRVHFTKLADWYDAFSLDLEAITFPKEVVLDGVVQPLGQRSAALIGWSKELATLVRQIAASASLGAAMKDTVQFKGSRYPMESFVKDATGEWGASLDLTAKALGVDLASL